MKNKTINIFAKLGRLFAVMLCLVNFDGFGMNVRGLTRAGQRIINTRAINTIIRRNPQVFKPNVINNVRQGEKFGEGVKLPTGKLFEGVMKPKEFVNFMEINPEFSRMVLPKIPEEQVPYYFETISETEMQPLEQQFSEAIENLAQSLKKEPSDIIDQIKSEKKLKTIIVDAILPEKVWQQNLADITLKDQLGELLESHPEEIERFRNDIIGVLTSKVMPLDDMVKALINVLKAKEEKIPSFVEPIETIPTEVIKPPTVVEKTIEPIKKVLSEQLAEYKEKFPEKAAELQSFVQKGYGKEMTRLYTKENKNFDEILEIIRNEEQRKVEQALRKQQEAERLKAEGKLPEAEKPIKPVEERKTITELEKPKEAVVVTEVPGRAAAGATKPEFESTEIKQAVTVTEQPPPPVEVPKKVEVPQKPISQQEIVELKKSNELSSKQLKTEKIRADLAREEAGRVGERFETTKRQLGDAQKKIEELSDNIKQKDAQIQQLEMTTKELEAKGINTEKLTTEIDNFKKETAVLKDQLSKKTEALTMLEKHVEAQGHELEEVKSKLTTVGKTEAENKQLLKRLFKLEQENIQARKSIGDISKQSTALTTKFEAAEKQIAGLQEQLAKEKETTALMVSDYQKKLDLAQQEQQKSGENYLKITQELEQQNAELRQSYGKEFERLKAENASLAQTISTIPDVEKAARTKAVQEFKDKELPTVVKEATDAVTASAAQQSELVVHDLQQKLTEAEQQSRESGENYLRVQEQLRQQEQTYKQAIDDLMKQVDDDKRLLLEQQEKDNQQTAEALRLKDEEAQRLRGEEQENQKRAFEERLNTELQKVIEQNGLVLQAKEKEIAEQKATIGKLALEAEKAKQDFEKLQSEAPSRIENGIIEARKIWATESAARLKAREKQIYDEVSAQVDEANKGAQKAEAAKQAAQNALVSKEHEYNEAQKKGQQDIDELNRKHALELANRDKQLKKQQETIDDLQLSEADVKELANFLRGEVEEPTLKTTAGKQVVKEFQTRFKPLLEESEAKILTLEKERGEKTQEVQSLQSEVQAQKQKVTEFAEKISNKEKQLQDLTSQQTTELSLTKTENEALKVNIKKLTDELHVLENQHNQELEALQATDTKLKLTERQNEVLQIRQDALNNELQRFKDELEKGLQREQKLQDDVERLTKEKEKIEPKPVTEPETLTQPKEGEQPKPTKQPQKETRPFEIVTEPITKPITQPIGKPQVPEQPPKGPPVVTVPPTIPTSLPTTIKQGERPPTKPSGVQPFKPGKKPRPLPTFPNVLSTEKPGRISVPPTTELPTQTGVMPSEQEPSYVEQQLPPRIQQPSVISPNIPGGVGEQPQTPTVSGIGTQLPQQPRGEVSGFGPQAPYMPEPYQPSWYPEYPPYYPEYYPGNSGVTGEAPVTIERLIEPTKKYEAELGRPKSELERLLERLGELLPAVKQGYSAVQ